MEIKELLTILKDGESSRIEFKKELSADFTKDACAFANTEGGKIFIGVGDNGDPIGVHDQNSKQTISDFMQALRPMPKFEIEEISLANIKLILLLIQKTNLLVSYKNIVYIRVGTNSYPLSIEEVIEKLGESLRVFFDEMITNVPFDHLDKEMFKNYLESRQKIRGIEIKGTIEENALQLKIARRKNNKLFLTNGGVLCFTRNPQEFIPGTSVRLVVFEDEEMKTYRDRKEFSGSLQVIVDDLGNYFSKSLGHIGGFTVGFRAKEFLEYPYSAIREAIVNAVIHRNYFDPSETQIFMFPNKLEIRNAGSFPPGISLENLQHKPRNPQIAQYFYDLGLSEKYGSGVKKIIREAENHPLSSVRFEIQPYRTNVIFEKNVSGVKLDKTSQQILELLTSGIKNSSEIGKYIGLSRQAAVARLGDLKTLGLINQVGQGPKTAYRLTEKS